MWVNPDVDQGWLGVFPITILGLCYSIYVVWLWPMIPLVIKPQIVGLAYGLLLAVQNLGNAIGPILVSLVSDDKFNNINMNILLLWFAIPGFFAAIGLWQSDKKKFKSILQKPSFKEIKKPPPKFKVIISSKKVHS